MEENSRLNLTPSGERRERSYLKYQIELNISQNNGKISSSVIVPINASSLDKAPHVCVDIIASNSSSSSSSCAGSDISMSSITPHPVDGYVMKGDQDPHPGTDPSTSHPHPPVYPSNSSDSQTKCHTMNNAYPARAYIDQQNNATCGKRKAYECETNDCSQSNNDFRNGGP